MVGRTEQNKTQIELETKCFLNLKMAWLEMKWDTTKHAVQKQFFLVKLRG